MIKTPILDKRIFNKIHVFPVTANHKQIHLTNRNYLTHETGNFIVSTLEPTIYKIHEVAFDSSRCIPNLFSGQQANCNYTMNPPKDEITIINNENIIINSDNNMVFTSTCGIINRTFTGTFLITFHDCEVNINNITYSNRVQNIGGYPIQLPLDGIIIQKQFTIANLSLEHLHHLHLETRKEMEYIRLNNTSLEWPTWSMLGGIFAFPCIITGTVFLLKIFLHRSATVKIKQISSNPPAEEPLKDIQPIIKPLTFREMIRTEPHL